VLHKTVVLDVVGLTPSVLGPHTPRLNAFLSSDRTRQASVTPILPAVTCRAQSTYLPGMYPSDHGIVGNGWY
jgi:predicted AlkP superfamily pyrophosphatase or phosphodiesterase